MPLTQGLCQMDLLPIVIMIFCHFQLFLAIFTKFVGDEAEHAANFD